MCNLENVYLGISEIGGVPNGCDLETTLGRHKYFNVLEHDTMWGPFRLYQSAWMKRLFVLPRSHLIWDFCTALFLEVSRAFRWKVLSHNHQKFKPTATGFKNPPKQEQHLLHNDFVILSLCFLPLPESCPTADLTRNTHTLIMKCNPYFCGYVRLWTRCASIAVGILGAIPLFQLAYTRAC